MAANSSGIKKSSITLVTFAILVLGALGYFYLYIQQREDALQARHYRVLNQIKQNILALNDTYLKNARNNAAKGQEELRTQAAVLFNENIQQDYEKVIRKIIDQTKSLGISADAAEKKLKPFLQQHLYSKPINSEDLELKQGFELKEQQVLLIDACKDSGEPKLLETNGNTRMAIKNCTLIIEKKLKENRDTNYQIAIEIPKINGKITFEAFEDYYKQKINLNYKLNRAAIGKAVYPQTTLREFSGGWELVYKDKIPLVEDSIYVVELTRSVGDLMSKVLRKDIFDELVVYRVRKDTSKAGVANAYNSIFQTFEENFFSTQLAGEMDSLLIRQLNSEKRHSIDGVPFRIYLQPLHILKGEKLFLCGLVDQNRFADEKASIPPVIILFICMLALMVLLAFPSLKLSLMSKNESLGVYDLFLSLFSLIMGTSMVALILFNGYRVFIQDEAQRKGELERLHQEVSDSLFAELKAIHAQLTYYDELEAPSGLPDPQVAIMGVLNPVDSTLYPKYYPYFNALLWATPEGRIGKEITLRDNPTPKVDITGRQYLEHFRNNTAWNLPGTNDGRRFILESILTRTTGDQLAVVSTESRTQAPIVFLSTYLHSVIHPVLPLGFGFCIIDPDGQVLFHSDPSRNLQENFMEECNVKDLRSAIFSRSELHAEGGYLGIDHNFYLKPLDKLPLYLITFEDKSYYRMAHAQTISLNFLFAVLFLLTALLFLGLLHLFRPDTSLLKRSSYILDWLRPSQLNTANYRALFLANLVMLLLLLLLTRKAGGPTAMLLIMGGNFYVFVLAFFILNRNSFREFNWSKYWHISIALGLIFVAFNAAAYLIGAIDLSLVLQFQLIPLLLIFFTLEYITRKGTALQRATDRLGKLLTGGAQPRWWQTQIVAGIKRYNSLLNHRRSYRFFLVSWLAISSIFPALKFYQISYDHERKLLTQLAHIQMDKDIQKRDQWIDQLYRPVNPRASSVRQLKNNGIYSRFYFDTHYNAPFDQDIQLHLQLPIPVVEEMDTGDIVLYHVHQDTSEVITIPGQLRSETRPVVIDSLLLAFNKKEKSSFSYVLPDRDNALIFTETMNYKKLKEWIQQDSSLVPGDSNWTLAAAEQFLAQESKHLMWGWKGTDSLRQMTGLQTGLRFVYPDLEKEKDQSSSFLASTLSLFRPQFNEMVRQTNRVNYSSSANKLWYWKPDGNRLRYYNDQLHHSISSVLPKYSFPTPFGGSELGVLFWTIFLAFIFVLYWLVDFHVDHLFSQDIINLKNLPPSSNKKLLLDTREHVFLVTPPAPLSSDHLEMLRRKAANRGAKALSILDMRELTNNGQTETEAIKLPEVDPGAPFLVLNHFDHRINQSGVYRQRMEILNDFRRRYPDKQLIVVGTKDQLLPPGEQSALAAGQTNAEEAYFGEEITNGFVKIIYPVEHWEPLNNQREFLDFTQKRTSFLQLIPTKVDAGQGVLDPGHNLGELKAKKELDFKYYLLNEPNAPKKYFLLIHEKDNAESLTEKGAFLERKREEGHHFHLLSTINPFELIRRYDEAGEAHQAAKETWINRLSDVKKGLVQISDKTASPQEKAQNRILKECTHSGYLQNIQQELMTQFGDGRTEEESIIRKIETRADFYYQALWASCSEEEQYMIYDLASDGIFNSKNRDVFNRLAQKGLIVIRGDNPRLMNKSFRNFILNSIKPETIQKMVKKVKKGSSWNQIKGLISIVILVLGAFLLATQRELIDNTLAIFTGIAAFVPFLREFVSNISMPEAKIPNFFSKGWGKK